MRRSWIVFFVTLYALSACGRGDLPSGIEPVLPQEAALPATEAPTLSAEVSDGATATYTPTATAILEDEYSGAVLFIFGHGFDFRHYEGTRLNLERAGYRVLVAAPSLEDVEGMQVAHGFESNSRAGLPTPFVQPDLALEDVRVADYRAIVFISDAEIMAGRNPEVRRIVEQAAEQGLALAAQEFGLYPLAGAGVLEGVGVTANPLICQHMQNDYGAICKYTAVQRDGRIVTTGPEFATARFVKAIIEAIQAQ